MKRSDHARLVAVGTVAPTPAVVDKHATWGAAVADPERVSRELAGEIPMAVCEPCGVALGGYWKARERHEQTQYHQRNAAS